MRVPDLDVKIARPRKSLAARRIVPDPLISTSCPPSGSASSEWISITPAGSRTDPVKSALRIAASGDGAQPVKGKSKGKRQRAKVKRETGAPTLLPFAFCLLPFDFPFKRLQSQPMETLGWD